MHPPLTIPGLADRLAYSCAVCALAKKRLARSVACFWCRSVSVPNALLVRFGSGAAESATRTGAIMSGWLKPERAIEQMMSTARRWLLGGADMAAAKSSLM